MKVNRSQKTGMAGAGSEAALIRDVLDNLELEHALTWLAEAISRKPGNTDEEPWHLYQTTLFSLYVDYGNGMVRLSAALACHDADMEIPLKKFLSVLKREAAREDHPCHFNKAEMNGNVHLHLYHNPYLKKRHREREPDSGYFS